MANLRMIEKLLNGEAIDISKFPRNADGDYIMHSFIEDVDYFDRINEVWIWSIGRNYKTGEILASTSGKFYMNKNYECLFLR